MGKPKSRVRDVRWVPGASKTGAEGVCIPAREAGGRPPHNDAPGLTQELPEADGVPQQVPLRQRGAEPSERGGERPPQEALRRRKDNQGRVRQDAGKGALLLCRGASHTPPT